MTLLDLPPLLGILSTVVASGAAYRIVGRIEGRAMVDQERLQRHSGAIKEHVVLFAQLGVVPEQIKELRVFFIELGNKTDGVGLKVDSLSGRFDRLCKDLGHDG